jgi:thioredoxin-like negative regulator of GroEL
MTTVTDATFQQVLDAPLAIVDFWAPSCPYCVQYKPVFEGVAAQMGDRIFMATANTNEAPKSAASYKIQSIPVTIFFVNGKEVFRAEGAMSQGDLLKEIDQVLATQEAGGGAPGAGSSESPVPAALNFLLMGGLLVGGAYLAAEYLAD